MAKVDPADDVVDALRRLLKAGLDLGVAEATRRLEAIAPPGTPHDPERMLEEGSFEELVDAARAEPGGLLQLIKEVWSRGDSKERLAAAHALGHALGRLAPHRALGLTKELASMARNSKEADLVGREAIEPLLESNPPFFDRVKLFLNENQPWLRRAAIAALVSYVGQRRKFAGSALEAILTLAERHEADIRAAVREAVRELSKVDWKATAATLAEWARENPTAERIKLVRQFTAAVAADARAEVQRFVFARLARLAEAPLARGR